MHSRRISTCTCTGVLLLCIIFYHFKAIQRVSTSLCSDSTVWLNSGLCVSGNQKHQSGQSQLKTKGAVCLKGPEAAQNRSSQVKTASSSQRVSVGPDFADEWDDWGDFDEENLMHASETSATSRDPSPRVPPSAAVSKPGAQGLVVQPLNENCLNSFVQDES